MSHHVFFIVSRQLSIIIIYCRVVAVVKILKSPTIQDVALEDDLLNVSYIYCDFVKVEFQRLLSRSKARAQAISRLVNLVTTTTG